MFARPLGPEAVARQLSMVLRVTSGDDMLRVARLEPQREMVVGRDPSADLCLSDASVSRRHAVVTATEKGCSIRDLGSTNGTFVNGERIRKEATLAIGERLEIGSVALRLERISEGEFEHLKRVLTHLGSARQDPLTGLMTRRWLEEDLPILAARAEEQKQPVTAMFFDIDRFKSVNDRGGHSLGDQVIKTVARLIAWSIRASDFGIRYGGEEFLVILTECDEPGAVATAERIRRKVASHAWPEEGLGSRIITLSAGIAVRGRAELIPEWLERADQALLRAKRSGRNRTLTAGPALPLTSAD